MTKVNLNGKYPCMANWVELHKNQDKVIAKNYMTDEEIVLSYRQAKYLTRLNGNRPNYKMNGFSIDECVDYYKFMEDNFLVREAGRCMSIEGTKLYTVFIPNKTRTNSVVPKILNFLLVISFLPIFIYGVYRILSFGVLWDVEEQDFLDIIFGILLGILLGTVLHETAHVFACLSNKYGRVFEVGIMFKGSFLGAYVFSDETDIKSWLARTQINLAGVEMNLLISGLLMIMMTWGDFFSECYVVMLYAVIINVVLVVSNLTFTEGLDGEHAISTIFDASVIDASVIDASKANILLLFDKKRRHAYFTEHGICGVANICTSIVLLFFQLTGQLVIATSIIVWIWSLFV